MLPDLLDLLGEEGFESTDGLPLEANSAIEPAVVFLRRIGSTCICSICCFRTSM